MTLISETYIHFDIELNYKAKIEFQNSLAKLSFSIGQEIFGSETQIHVQVDDGSIKSWCYLCGSLYIAIAQYGSFRSGIDYIIRDSQSLSELVYDQASKRGLLNAQIIRFERRLGAPGKIKRTLKRLEWLQEHPNYMSSELPKIRKSVLEIFELLDHPEDRQLVFENLPSLIKNTLPPTLPNQRPEMLPFLRRRAVYTNGTTFKGGASLQADEEGHKSFSKYEFKPLETKTLPIALLIGPESE